MQQGKDSGGAICYASTQERSSRHLHPNRIHGADLGQARTVLWQKEGDFDKNRIFVIS
jgi:hypothetical protein